MWDDGEDADERPVCVNIGGPATNEEDGFEFNVTESTTPIPASLGSSEMLSATVEAATDSISDSMVPLVDAPEHGIMPLGGEGEEDPGFLISVEASGGSGLLLPGPST